MHKDLKNVLVSEEEINKTVSEIADRINKDYEGEEILLLVVLKGSMPFATDLMRKLNVPVRLDFIQASSYGNGTKSSGNIVIKHKPEQDLAGKNILIIEDIIDSGNTLYTLKKLMKEENPKSVKVCTMLDKPSRREADIVPDYVGRQIPDEFVVGYGLDFDERYRELPYIGILGEWIYQ